MLVPIVVENGVDAVGYGEYGALVELLSDGGLDERVCLKVNGGRSFVQHQHLGPTQQGPC